MERATAERLVRYDTVLFDADGVLWLGERPVPGAVQALARLAALGKRVLVVTNNATKTPAEYARKVEALGFALSADQVVSAAAVAAHELARDARRAQLPVYLIGSPSLAATLAASGVDSFGVGADPLPGPGVSHVRWKLAKFPMKIAVP